MAEIKINGIQINKPKLYFKRLMIQSLDPSFFIKPLIKDFLNASHKEAFIIDAKTLLEDGIDTFKNQIDALKRDRKLNQKIPIFINADLLFNASLILKFKVNRILNAFKKESTVLFLREEITHKPSFLVDEFIEFDDVMTSFEETVCQYHLKRFLYLELVKQKSIKKQPTVDFSKFPNIHKNTPFI